MKTNLKLKPNSKRCDKLWLQSQIVGATHRTDIKQFFFFVNLQLILVLLYEVWVGFGVAETIIYFFYSQLAWQHDNNSNSTPDCLCSKVVRGPTGNDAVAIYIWVRTAADKPIAACLEVACVSHIKVRVKSISVAEESAYSKAGPVAYHHLAQLGMVTWRLRRGLSMCTLDQYSLGFFFCVVMIQLNWKYYTRTGHNGCYSKWNSFTANITIN